MFPETSEAPAAARTGLQKTSGTKSAEGVALAQTARSYLRPRFLVLTASLRSLPALKRTVLLALIVIDSPVAGLRPLRAPRSATAKLPRPGILTDSPALRESETAPTTAS